VLVRLCSPPFYAFAVGSMLILQVFSALSTRVQGDRTTGPWNSATPRFSSWISASPASGLLLPCQEASRANRTRGCRAMRRTLQCLRTLSSFPRSQTRGGGWRGAGGRAAPQARELTGSVVLFGQQGARCPHPLLRSRKRSGGYRVLQRPHHPTPFPPPPWVGERMMEGWGAGGRMRQANNLAPKGGTTTELLYNETPACEREVRSWARSRRSFSISAESA
jgi:hypothetical protein